MKHTARSLLCIVLLSGCGKLASRDAGSVSAPLAEPPSVSYCELIAAPDRYLNNEVRLRTVYRYGMEWTEAYSLTCIDAPATWVEFTKDTQACSSPQAWKHIEEGLEEGGFEGATLGVVFRGKLVGVGGAFGHQNGYANLFEVTCVESAKVLDQKSDHRRQLEPEMRKRVDAFETTP